MDITDPTTGSAFVAAALLLLSWLALRRRAPRAAPPVVDRPDTIADWPPRASRVLTTAEREAYDLLRRALPGFMVLAQVPLARFLHVPAKHAYGDWMRRVGQLNADIVVCDASSRVLAVVDLRGARETERTHRRHERLGRVLKAAGIGVEVWREGELPGAAEVRDRFADLLSGKAPPAAVALPLTPALPPDIAAVLAAGDVAFDKAQEPVHSAFFDELQDATARR